MLLPFKATVLACIIHRMPPAHGSQRVVPSFHQVETPFVVPSFHQVETPFVVPSFHKGGVRGGSCNLTDPQPPNLGGSRTDPQPPNLGGLKSYTNHPNPSFMKGGDYEMEAFYE